MVRAKQIAARGERPAAAAVFAELVGASSRGRGGEEALVAKDRVVGSIRRSAGKTVISFEKGVLGESELSRLKKFLGTLLADKG
jgi:hypothetical protein